jgi:hypothetical protein
VLDELQHQTVWMAGGWVLVRISRDRERQERRIVNAGIGMVNARIGIMNAGIGR